MSIQELPPQRPQGIVDPRRDVPIEPVGQPEAPKPFTPGVGTWIGAGVGALLLGGLAAGVGGAMLLAGGGASSMRTALGIAGTVGIGLAGAAGGAWIAHNMSKGGHEDSEAKRVQLAFGTSTLENARELMTRFDHDTNGEVNLDRVGSTGLEGTDERVFVEKRDQSSSKLDYDWWDDDWDVDTTRWTESRGVSAAPLWEQANVDPKDQVVSDVEVAKVMAQFDTDRSGTLTIAERDAFTAANPFIYEDWRK